MTTSSRPRRPLRRLCATLFATLPAAFAVAAFAASPWFSGAARGADGLAPGDDLNLLLRLLSQDIRIGRLELARPIDPLWLKDIRGLQSSSVAAVAETARAVEESAKMREAALKVLEEAEAKNQQIVKENPYDVVEAVKGLLPDGVSDEDIEAAVRSYRITPSEAAAYRARRAARDDALMTLGKVALLTYANSYLANDKVRGTRRLAETLEANALAEHLVPALAARAGAKRADPPLKIFTGFAIDRQHEPRLITTIFSTSDEPLTQLTLLMEFRIATGRRRAVVFIPRLEPRQGVQVTPVPADFRLATPLTDDEKKKGPAAGIHHTVWCDQFTFESGDTSHDKYANAAYCALEAEAGRGYSFDNIGRGRPRDGTSYVLEFTEFKLAKGTCHVKGKISFYENNNREKASKVTPFEAAFRAVELPAAPPAKARKGAVPPRPTDAAILFADAQLTVGSGKMKSNIDFYINDSGRVDWIVRTGPLHNRAVSTVEEARKAHDMRADLMKNNMILGGARQLAREGKTEEAARALNDYIASSPGEEWVKEAQRVLKELDTLAAEGARMKDSRGNSPRQPGTTKPKSRPGAKPQAQSPPKRS